MFYNIRNGIKNIFRWFPIIWKDRDWDHYYLFKMLHFKLNKMEKCLRDGCHLNADETADKIKICTHLITRIIDDEYYNNVFKEHDKKWGKIEINYKDYVKDDRLVECAMTRSNIKNKKDKEQERKEYRLIMNKPDELRKQDIQYLFKIMGKNILSWWD